MSSSSAAPAVSYGGGTDADLVTVVMPVLDEAPWIADAIGRVLTQTYGNLEILVADGGSTDGTRALVESIAASDRRVRLIDNPRQLQSAGLNETLRQAHGRVLVRLDARSFIRPDYVERCVETLGSTGAAVVGGRMVPVPQTRWIARGIALANRRPWGAGPARFHHSARSGPAETVYLGAFVREVVDQLGGWSESVGVNEDYELNHRIREAGEVVWFDAELEVGYQPRFDVRGLVKQYARYGRSKATVIRRHPSSTRLRQVVPTGLAPLGLAALVARHRRLALLGIAAHAALVAGGASVERESASDRTAGAVAAWLMHWSWSVGFWWGVVHPFPSASEPGARSEQDPAPQLVKT